MLKSRNVYGAAPCAEPSAHRRLPVLPWKGHGLNDWLWKRSRTQPSGGNFRLALWLGVGLVVAALVGPGCSKKAEAPAGRMAVPVTVRAVQKRDVPVEVQSFGVVEAFSSVSIKVQVAGTLTEVLVKEGQRVKANQPLFTIDPRTYEATVKQLEANLAKDAVLAKRLRQEADRMAGALAKGASSPDEVDQAKATAAAAAATQDGDQAALDNAKVQLSYCRIVSPIDGVAGKLLVNQGNAVKAYDISLLTINQIQPIYVAFTLPQQYLPQVRQYSDPTLHGTGDGNLAVYAAVPNQAQKEEGELVFVDNTVEAASGTITLKAQFANAQERLWPGQFVNTTLVLTTQKDALVVPSRALQTGQQGQFVFVAKPDNTVESRPVKTGLSVGGMIVVETGLAEGEVVVLDGQLRLTNGAPIKILPDKSSSQPAGGAVSSSGPATQPAATAPDERKPAS